MKRVLQDIKKEIETNKNKKFVIALKLYEKVLLSLDIKDGMDLIINHPQVFAALKELLALIQKKCKYCQDNGYKCNFEFPCCCCIKDRTICKYFIKFKPTGALKARKTLGLQRYGKAKRVMFESIGYSVGGAMDVKNFRENIKGGYLPKETDITYEGIFYGYYFDTGNYKPKNKPFYPTYSIHVENFNNQIETYMTVGFNSNIKDFVRNPLDVVIVLDISGSMSSPLRKYHYDRFFKGEAHNREPKSKMEVANECITHLIDKLTPQDRLSIVLFDDKAKKFMELDVVKNPEDLKKRVLQIKYQGGTNMEYGYKVGTTLFKKTTKDKRIIFITDAMPNTGGTESNELQTMIEVNSLKGIYTTFVGVGVDFNTELIDFMAKVRGANYYSVHDPTEFKKRLADEFDFMVSPLIFDVELLINSRDYEIEEVYGTPDADKTTGKIMYINTLFPSSSKEGEVRGGVVLLKLNKIREGSIELTLKYKDKQFNPFVEKEKIIVKQRSNTGIQKAILLTRYVSLIKEWINADEKKQITNQVGWERGSKDLIVSEKYKRKFENFLNYFKEKAKVLNDKTLNQEINVLENLKDYTSKEENEFVLDKGEFKKFSDIIIVFESFEIRTKRTELKVSFLHRKDPKNKEEVIFYQEKGNYKLEHVFDRYKIYVQFYYILCKPIKIRAKFSIDILRKY